MNTEKIRASALLLEEEVRKAKAAGYKNADCVLTAEVNRLLPLAKAGKITSPVVLEYTAGPAWNFFETSLGECKALESAWANFRSAVEDWESRPGYQAARKLFEEQK